MAGIKFGFKVKIVQSYERLFDQNFISVLESNNKEASDFWQEFFLLKVFYNIDMLTNKLNLFKSFAHFTNLILNENRPIQLNLKKF